jgi:hypothetical protein
MQNSAEANPTFQNRAPLMTFKPEKESLIASSYQESVDFVDETESHTYFNELSPFQTQLTPIQKKSPSNGFKPPILQLEKLDSVYPGP